MDTVQLLVIALQHLLSHSGMREEELLARCQVVTPYDLTRIKAANGTVLVHLEIAADLAQAIGVPIQVLVDHGALDAYRLAKQVLEENGQPDDMVFYDMVIERRYAARTSSYERTTSYVALTIQDVRELYYAYCS